LALGCSTSFLGFWGLWAAITHRFNASFWQLVVLAVVAGNGGTWFDTTSLATNLRNFPAARGTTVGLIKASVGLSASLYTAAYTSAFDHRADQFLMFLAIVPAAVGILAVPLINYVPYVQSSEIDRGRRHRAFSTEGRFLFALQNVGFLALYLMTTALVTGTHHVSDTVKSMFGFGALVLLLPFFLVPYDSGGIYATPYRVTHADSAANVSGTNRESDPASGNYEDEEAHPHQPLLLPAASVVDPTPMPPPMITESLRVAECFTNLNFWLLAVTCGIGIGAGLAFLNNSAQLIAAVEGPKKARGVLVSVFGVASCYGRLVFGFVPEKALRYGTPRSLFLVFSAASTSIIYAILPSVDIPLLYAVAVVAGLAFGAHWSLLPTLCSELFGLDSFASIYTLLQLAPAGGGYVLGAVLVPSWYDEAMRRHGETIVCTGHDCFKAAFLIISGFSGLATLLSVWLMVRTLRLYRREASVLCALDED